MINHKLGLVSVSFRQNSPEEILPEMKKNNLSHVEWGSDIHAPCHDIKRLHELAKLQKEYGVCCCSYGTYFRLGIADINELEYYADAAKILGTGILRVWCGDKNADLCSEYEKSSLFEASEKAEEIAKKHDVVLCMECHNNSYTETLDGALELMKKMNSRHFQMYWQPNQFKDFDTNMQYAKNISSYVENIHVFNWKGNEKYPLFDAKDTWRKYLSNFKTAKNLLLEFMPDGRLESLKTEADALFEIVQNN